MGAFSTGTCLLDHCSSRLVFLWIRGIPRIFCTDRQSVPGFEVCLCGYYNRAWLRREDRRSRIQLPASCWSFVCCSPLWRLALGCLVHNSSCPRCCHAHLSKK